MDKFIRRASKTLPIFVALAMCSGFAHSTSTNQFSPSLKDYGQLPAVQLMAVSPSGERIAYRKIDEKNNNILVYSLAENKIISGFNAERIEPKSIYFISENKLIILVSHYFLPNETVNKGTTNNAYVFNVKTKQLKTLLNGPKIYPYQDKDKVIGLSPDKKTLYMGAFSGEKLSMYDQLRPKYSLLKVRLNKVRSPSFHSHGTNNTIDYFVDKNGDPLVEERYDQRNDQHSVLVRADKKWQKIYTKTDKIRTIEIVGLTSDYASLVVLKYNNDTGRVAYYLMSLIDGSLSLSDMSRSDADIDDVITDINRVVHGVAYSGFNRSYKFFDPELDQRVKSILVNFPDHTVRLESWSPDWKNILVYAEGPSSPGDYYLFPLGKDPVFVATARPNIAPEAIHPIAELKFTARDGMKIPTLLTIPQQHIGSLSNLPAVIMPHGGPESYDQIGFDWLAQAIANHGYLVVQPQFRGSTGFGLAHKQAGHGEWGKKMQDDLSDSVAFLAKKGIINPAKVCIAGSSYGGYAALAGGAFTPELYKCVISVNGVSDLNKMISSKEYYAGSDHWVVSYWEKLMAKGDVNKKSLAAVSPINFANNFTASTLLIHGEKDLVVRSYQSERMYSELKSSDKTVKYVELDGENHYLLTRKGRLKALIEIMLFLDSQIGG
jgi:dipeptidyl aminopeptidase/acylaminoacyl peptidase